MPFGFSTRFAVRIIGVGLASSAGDAVFGIVGAIITGGGVLRHVPGCIVAKPESWLLAILWNRGRTPTSRPSIEALSSSVA